MRRRSAIATRGWARRGNRRESTVPAKISPTKSTARRRLSRSNSAFIVRAVFMAHPRDAGLHATCGTFLSTRGAVSRIQPPRLETRLARIVGKAHPVEGKALSRRIVSWLSDLLETGRFLAVYTVVLCAAVREELYSPRSWSWTYSQALPGSFRVRTVSIIALLAI